MTTPPSKDKSSLERRIAELELSLGLVADPSSVKSDPNRDVRARIDLLLSGGGGPAASPSSESLAKEIDACDRLASNLDPGSILTHQSTAASSSASAAPLLYRRQEILASRERLGEDLDRLGRVRDLLLLAPSKGEAAGGVGGGGFPPEASVRSAGGRTAAAALPKAASATDDDGGRRFLEAPILASDRYGYACDPEATRRLDAVSSKVVDLNYRARAAASRIDELLGRYHGVMAAVSEKLVMADEELAAAGR